MELVEIHRGYSSVGDGDYYVESELDFLTGEVSFGNSFYGINEDMEIHIDGRRDPLEQSWSRFVEEIRRLETVIIASKSELDFLTGEVSFRDNFYRINEDMEIYIDWGREPLEHSWSRFVEEIHRPEMVITASKSELDFLTGEVSFGDNFYEINEDMKIRIDWKREPLEWSWSRFVEEIRGPEMVITTSKSKLDFLIGEVSFGCNFYGINEDIEICNDGGR